MAISPSPNIDDHRLLARFSMYATDSAFAGEGVVAAVLTAVLTLTATSVGLRFYTRHVLSKNVGADDWAAAITFVRPCAPSLSMASDLNFQTLTLACGISIALSASDLSSYFPLLTEVPDTVNGLGHHVGTLQPGDIKNYWRVSITASANPFLLPLTLLSKGFYVSVIFYRASLVAGKTCFLLQYIRIFPIKSIRNISVVLLAVVGVWGVSQLFLTIFQCWPVSGFWDKDINHTCLPMAPQWYVHAAGNIATDIAIFILPIPVLHTLSLPLVEKILIFFVFGLGFL